MIQRNSGLSIRRQCELIGLNRSTVYYAPKEPTEEYRQWIELIMEKIDYWHTKMPYLGARRLSAKLNETPHRMRGFRITTRTGILPSGSRSLLVVIVLCYY